MRNREIQRIKALVAGQILTMTVAIVSLDAKAAAIQTSRRDSRLDSCFLLRGLAYAAAPPTRHAELQAYLNRTELRNCPAYARHLP